MDEERLEAVGYGQAAGFSQPGSREQRLVHCRDPWAFDLDSHVGGSSISIYSLSLFQSRLAHSRGWYEEHFVTQKLTGLVVRGDASLVMECFGVQ